MIDRANAPATTIPAGHGGVDYRRFSAEISRKRGSKLYMEIGVQNGVHLSNIMTDRAIGIDPHFLLSTNVAAHKKSVELYQMTSDAFFAAARPASLSAAELDLVFLDGLHVFEYLLRDFYNTERLANRNALVMMHDCLPLNAKMTERNEARAYELGQETDFPGAWTGDVWKIIPILRKYRPDLKVVCVDCPPTGLVCVTGLDPQSTVLESQYLKIVDEFRHLANDEAAILDLYREIEIVGSMDILRDFNHTLYFRS